MISALSGLLAEAVMVDGLPDCTELGLVEQLTCGELLAGAWKLATQQVADSLMFPITVTCSGSVTFVGCNVGAVLIRTCCSPSISSAAKIVNTARIRINSKVLNVPRRYRNARRSRFFIMSLARRKPNKPRNDFECD